MHGFKPVPSRFQAGSKPFLYYTKFIVRRTRWVFTKYLESKSWIVDQIFTKEGPTSYVRVILTWNDNLFKKYEILFILKCAKLMQKDNVYSSSLMQFRLAWNSRFIPRS